MCLLRRQRLSLGTFKRSLCCGMAALLSTSALAAEGASRNIRIDPFDRLILFSSDTVIIESGATSASVDVTGPAEVIAAVSIRQVGRVLEVSRLNQPSRDTNAVIVIKTPSVSQIELNSSGSIELAPGHLDRLAAIVRGSGTINLPGLDGSNGAFEAAGSGHLKIKGRIDQVDLTVSGSGSVAAEQLNAATLRASVTGSGTLAAQAHSAATLLIAGSGTGHISGTANCQVTVTGAGRGFCTPAAAHRN